MPIITLSVEKLFESLVAPIRRPGMTSNIKAGGIITAAAALVIYSRYNKSKKTNDCGCPTVPYFWPLVGSTPEFLRSPRDFLEKWTAKLGPVYRFYMFGEMMLIVSQEHLRQVVFSKNFDSTPAMKRAFDTRLLMNAGTLDDLPNEHVAYVVRKFIATRTKAHLTLLIQSIEGASFDILGDLNEPMELEHFHSFVEHVVAKTSISNLLGRAASENDELVENFKATVADTATKVRPGSTWLTWLPGVRQWHMWYIGKTSPLVRRHREIMFETITPIIQHRLHEMKNNPNWEKPSDIMQDVLEKFEPPRHMDRITYIANWMSTLSFSSIYPTSETATIVLYRLVQNRHLIDELLEEQLRVVRDAGFGDDYGNDVFTPEVVEKFVLLNSICREALRLKNESLSVPRVYIGEEDFVLNNGTVIRPGQLVLANVFCTHRKTINGSVEMADEIAEMKRFNPYRYVECATPSSRILEDYLPFGYGRNACPGRAFGMQMVKVLISVILKNYKFSAVEDPSFPIQDRIFLPHGKIMIAKRK